MTTLKELEKYIEKNGTAEMAQRLGYRDSSTISQWIRRGRIPGFREKQVQEILKEKK